MPNRPVHVRSVVRAAHLILTGYGHWLPNDPRGSGSAEIRKPELEDLAPIHPGRNPVQPPREELRAFHRNAAPLLKHPVLWFEEEDRQAIARGFEIAIGERGYTVWACAILRNHAHLVIRTHRDSALEMHKSLAHVSREAFVADRTELALHPIWSERPYKVFLKTDMDIQGRIAYVENNPVKERLPRQSWKFLTPYRR